MKTKNEYARLGAVLHELIEQIDNQWNDDIGDHCRTIRADILLAAKALDRVARKKPSK